MTPSVLRAVLIATLLAAQLGTVALFAADAHRRVADELDADGRVGRAALAETPGTRPSPLESRTGASPIALAEATVGDILTRSRWLPGALLMLSFATTAVIFGITAPLVRIHRDATVDRLTGALARAEFERRLERLLADRRASARGDRTLVAALDLDGFKAINDTHGHAAGDEVLAEFVRRLKERLHPGDLLGRAGGDEFLIALRLPAAADVHGVLERVRRHAVGTPIAGKEGRYDVGVTVGVARCGPGDTPVRLLTRADRALIDGKTFEKNRVYIASDARPPASMVPGGRSAPPGIAMLASRPEARPVRA